MNDKKMYAVKCPSPPFLLLIGRECPSVLGLLSFETCIIQAEHRINDWTSPRAFGYIVGLDLLGAVAWWESKGWHYARAKGGRPSDPINI